MPEEKDEKVRIPADLMAELRREIGAAQMRGEKAPAMGDLLAAAWRSRKPAEPEFPELKGVHRDRLRRAARILAGKYPEIRDGLGKNIDLFDELYDMRELQGRRGPRS